ncbi:hypothetical protein DL98DRAFT_232829 [Cadophora sp. DSE1049]|nr:hypothetical protein DL98DRAFT_232829 [Cadophora sp. DSE1049]
MAEPRRGGLTLRPSRLVRLIPGLNLFIVNLDFLAILDFIILRLCHIEIIMRCSISRCML